MISIFKTKTRVLRFAAIFGSVFALASCGNLSPMGEKAGTKVEGRTTPVSNYTGPRARVAVLRFTDATGGKYSGRGYWYNKDIGDGMARKLSSALLATKRFRILNRKNMNDLMQEINFGNSGAVQSGTASKFGKMIGARLVITAAITDFEDAGGKKAQAGGGGIFGGKLGVLGGAFKSNRTYMAINLEMVDVETSELVASEQISATITDTKVDVGALLVGPGAFGGALSSWEKEPKGKALQEVINKAVEYLSQNVPQEYYTESGVNSSAKKPSGSNSLAVKAQKALKSLGLYTGPIDGDLGPGSQKAIRTYQQQLGINPTGGLDAKTTSELMKICQQIGC